MKSEKYTYDELRRLLTAQRGPDTNVRRKYTYDFDRYGNRWQQIVSGGSGLPSALDFAPNTPDNRIITTGFSYDASGNLTANGAGTSYAYDKENFATSATSTVGSGTYVMDAVGRRAKKTVSGTTTEFFYIGAEIISEKTGTAGKDYVFFGGQRIAEQTGATETTVPYLHTDHLGSTRVCTNSSGASNGTCDYEPYGEVQPGSSCSVPTKFRFAGMQWDDEAQLYHTWFRKYDPNQGRWMGVDPLSGSTGDPQTLNRYAYVRNDPINYFDPLGLKCYLVTELAEGGGIEWEELPDYTDKQSCEDHGGTWVPDVYTTVTVTAGGGGATTYYHYDHLSPRVMTNTGGAIVAQSGHYPFGENWYETAANKLKFTTYERDNTPSEGGDDYAMLRSYINRFGRFSAPDLLAGRLPNPQTLNRYAYSLNNPINLSDPLGLSPCGDEPGMPPCPLLIEGGDPFGFGCTLDGISVGCGWVSRSTIYEVAVPCPNNICFGAAWDSRINTWVNVQFVAFAGGTSGYFRPSDLTSGVHEFNGRIYNTANWNILVQMTFAERIDAQRHATARAIAEQSGGKISEQDAYARLSVDGGFLRGGELQFCD